MAYDYVLGPCLDNMQKQCYAEAIIRKYRNSFKLHKYKNLLKLQAPTFLPTFLSIKPQAVINQLITYYLSCGLVFGYWISDY